MPPRVPAVVPQHSTHEKTHLNYTQGSTSGFSSQLIAALVLLTLYFISIVPHFTQMPVNCGECGGSTVWDDDAASSICLTCGTLTDPSQSILTSHIDQPENTRQSGFLNTNSASAITLKSFRTRQGWDLAGQGKEARDNRNTNAMHDFIRSLSVALSVPGLSPRVINLFTQAMSAGQFRWGRKARCVAGVCLAIALRETNRPDSIRDIASILEEPPPILTRTFMSVLTLLNISLSLADPSIHVPNLEARINAIVQAPATSNLPSALIKKLSILHIPSVMRTVQSLSDVIFRLGESSEVTTLPTGPTAAALLMLALEAEIRSSLPNLGELAQNLASLINVKGPVVMARYKIMQDSLAEWIKKLPWTDKYDTAGGRAKLAKRTVVARSLKDLVQFHEDIWVQRLEDLKKQQFNKPITCEPKDDDATEPESPSPSISPLLLDEKNEPPRKKRKVNGSLDQAHQFILDPITHQLPSSVSRTVEGSTQPLPRSRPSTPPPLGNSPDRPSMMTYMLTVSPSVSSGRAPTRLQLLSSTRGGESKVTDEELVSDAEWGRLLRSEEEMAQLQTLWEQNTSSDKDDESKDNFDSQRATIHAKGKQKQQSKETLCSSGRVNMDAYNRFMHGSDIEGDLSDGIHIVDPATTEAPDETDEKDEDAPLVRMSIDYIASNAFASYGQDDGEIVVDEWRPLSPTVGNIDDRYEGYYDF